jgi:small subunit ribosomal protein S20
LAFVVNGQADQETSHVAHSISAKKRVRQNAKRRLRNRDRKRAIRVELKKTQTVITATDKAGAVAEFKKAQQILDRISTRGGIHKNTAARRKSKLAKKINALKAK